MLIYRRSHRIPDLPRLFVGLMIGLLLSSSVAAAELSFDTSPPLAEGLPAHLDADFSTYLDEDEEDKRPDPTHAFFLRVHETLQYPEGNGEVLAFIFRDGLTLLFNTTAQGQLSVFRSDAANVAELQRQLAEIQIGTLEGNCDLPWSWSLAPDFDLPAGVTNRAATLSWFGNRDRSNHLEFKYQDQQNRFGEECSTQLANLALDISSTIQRLFDPPVTPPQLFRADSEVLYVINNSFQEDPDCGDDGFVDDYFVFRDGLVVRNAQSYSGSYALMRGRAPRATLRELRQELANQRVGFQGGKCLIWFFQPFTVGGGCGDYTWQSGATWYGANGRRSTLFGMSDTQTSCNFEQRQIGVAVTQFLRNTSAQEQTHHRKGYFSRP